MVMAPILKIHTKTIQAQEFLENEIRLGHLKPGERLQSMRELATQFGVSTMVINSALDILEERGLVKRLPRQGVLIADPAEAKRTILAVYSPAGQDSPTPYILPEFEAACLEHGFQVERLDIDFIGLDSNDKLFRILSKKNLHSVLLCGAAFQGDEAEIRFFQRLGLPTVIPHGDAEDFTRTGFTVFYSDTRRIWFEALQHLKSEGFRHIGALGLLRNRKTLWRSGTVEEHEQMLAALGLPPIPPAAPEFDDVEEFDRMLDEYLKQYPYIEVLLCYSDFIALKVYHYCRRKKIRIPQDLAVMGICGYPGAALLSPALTTIDMQYAGIGRTVADWMCSPDGKKDKNPVFLSPHKLILGESARKMKS